MYILNRFSLIFMCIQYKLYRRYTRLYTVVKIYYYNYWGVFKLKLFYIVLDFFRILFFCAINSLLFDVSNA